MNKVLALELIEGVLHYAKMDALDEDYVSGGHRGRELLNALYPRDEIGKKFFHDGSVRTQGCRPVHVGW